MSFKQLLQRPAVRGVIKVCQLAILFIVAQLGAGFLALLGARLCGRDASFLAEAPVLAATVALGDLLVVLFLWPLRMVRWRTLFARLGMSRACACRTVLGALLFCLALNIVAEFVELPDLMQAEFLELARHPLGVFAIGILGPVCEELVFREAMIGTMRRRGMSMAWAIGLSSFLFGVVHGNPAQIPFAFFVGCLLGWIYWISGNILLTSIIHILNNSLAVVEIWLLGPAAPDFSLTDNLGGPAPSVAVVALALLLSAACLRPVWKRHGQGTDA